MQSIIIQCKDVSHDEMRAHFFSRTFNPDYETPPTFYEQKIRTSHIWDWSLLVRVCLWNLILEILSSLSAVLWAAKYATGISEPASTQFKHLIYSTVTGKHGRNASRHLFFRPWSQISDGCPSLCACIGERSLEIARSFNIVDFRSFPLFLRWTIEMLGCGIFTAGFIFLSYKIRLWRENCFRVSFLKFYYVSVIKKRNIWNVL